MGTLLAAPLDDGSGSHVAVVAREERALDAQVRGPAQRQLEDPGGEPTSTEPRADAVADVARAVGRQLFRAGLPAEVDGAAEVIAIEDPAEVARQAGDRRAIRQVSADRRSQLSVGRGLDVRVLQDVDLSVRATEEVCILLGHPNFEEFDGDAVPELLKKLYWREPGAR